MGISQLGYVGIGVSDLAAWEEFATQVLGLEVVSRGADGVLYLRMDDYSYRIALHPTGKDDVAYVGWEVKDTESLREIASRIEASGVPVARPAQEERDRRQVLDLVRIEDPNGVTVELFCGPLIPAAPFRPTRPISGFKAGLLGLGHVVFMAKDLPRTVSFYQDLLGFRLSDVVSIGRPGAGDAKLVFYHCNPRHHSIAFGTMPRPRKLSHIMLELNSLDDVGSTYYLCQDKGLTITRTLGRHSNDCMFSFYVQTPSGFDIEYGWGGREIDEATWVVQQRKGGSLWGHRMLAG